MNKIEQLQAIIAALVMREPDSEQIARLEQQRDDCKQRAENAEAELAQARADVEHYVELGREYYARAEKAAADANDYLDRATCAEQDRDRVEAQARGWKVEAENAKTEREAWEENHQILSEHFQRMTERAQKAENDLKFELWRVSTRLEGWKNDAQTHHDY